MIRQLLIVALGFLPSAAICSHPELHAQEIGSGKWRRSLQFIVGSATPKAYVKWGCEEGLTVGLAAQVSRRILGPFFVSGDLPVLFDPLAKTCTWAASHPPGVVFPNDFEVRGPPNFAPSLSLGVEPGVGGESLHPGLSAGWGYVVDSRTPFLMLRGSLVFGRPSGHRAMVEWNLWRIEVPWKDIYWDPAGGTRIDRIEKRRDKVSMSFLRVGLVFPSGW
jgi:hypothetical protein